MNNFAKTKNKKKTDCYSEENAFSLHCNGMKVNIPIFLCIILVANPQSAKREELLNTLDQRTDPMPDSMWVEILQGMDTVGALERLESELAGWMQRHDLYFNGLAEIFMNDTVNAWAPDSLIALFDSDARLSSRYLLVQYYLDHLNFSQANVILQDIPIQFDLTNRQSATHQKYLTLVNMLPQLFHDTLGYRVPDSLQTLTLEQLAAADQDFPGAWARNILIAAGLMNYQESIVTETTLKSSRKDRYHWTRSRPIASEFKIFPNPAKDFVIIEYRKQNSWDDIVIDILDAKGRRIRTYGFSQDASQKIISFEGFASGTYMIQLIITGSVLESQKLIIIR